MEKQIPFQKLSKKKQREENRKHRNTWGPLSPVTRRPENPKAYNRRKAQKRMDDPRFCAFSFWEKAPDCFSSLPMLYWWGRGIPDAPRPALPRASPFFFGRRAICYSEKERAPCREDAFKI